MSRWNLAGTLVALLLCACPRPSTNTSCNNALDCTGTQDCVDGTCVARVGGGSSGQVASSGESAPASGSAGSSAGRSGVSASGTWTTSAGASSGSGGNASSGACGQGLVLCGGNCINPETDFAYCGATADCQGNHAGETCVGKDCINGHCVLTCPSMLVRCADATGTLEFCVDPNTSRTNCGASLDCAGPHAGDLCPVGGSCSGGMCGCGAGKKDCHGTCIPDTTCCDNAECLGGRYCLPSVANGPTTCQCQAGDVECNGTCVSAGSCCQDSDCSGGQVCGAPVSSGAGLVRRCGCPAGQALCNGVCSTTGGCCASGDCAPGQACTPPGDGGAANVCVCPGNGVFCAAQDRCIPAGTCCTSTDCAPGKVCTSTSPTAPPACECAPGSRACNGTCVASNLCCLDAECGAGKTCQAGSCQCAPNTRLCGTQCIPLTACCTQPQDCPSGFTCPSDGASCVCAGSTVACGATCIPANTCCSTGASCTGGHVCTTPGTTCTCPAGTHGCNGTCIPDGRCCNAPDSCGPGLHCPAPGATCVSLDCVYTVDASFGACNASCGGGTQSKHAHVIEPAQPGGSCPYTDGQVVATQSCNTQPCGMNCSYYADASFGACNAACGGGVQYRYFHVTTPAVGSGTCPVTEGSVAEAQGCNTQPCPVDCVFTQDATFGACSTTCGSGQQARYFHVTQPAQFGGTCPVTEGQLVQSQSCTDTSTCVSACAPGDTYEAASNSCISTGSQVVPVTSNTISASVCNDHFGIATFVPAGGASVTALFTGYSPSYVPGWNCGDVTNVPLGTMTLTATDGSTITDITAVTDLTFNYTSTDTVCGPYCYDGDGNPYDCCVGGGCVDQAGTATMSGSTQLSYCPGGGAQTPTITIYATGNATITATIHIPPWCAAGTPVNGLCVL